MIDLNHPRTTAPPSGSIILSRMEHSHFHDAWHIGAGNPDLSALGQFLKMLSHTPRWVDRSMALRNRVASWLGLKHLGPLSAIDPSRPEEAYARGERIGIFTLFEKTRDEVLLGDRDKHLDVMLSVHCGQRPNTVVTITTVVHVHNALGRLYMVPVTPMHKLIAPVTMKYLALP